jgi:ATP-dependent RNA helicase DeaD
MSEDPAAPKRFSDLALSAPVLRALEDVGYEAPSPIQAATIPPLLAGTDVLGQAQTGTGKTAAFALPILSRLDARSGAPQALVLAPTRELAIQVAEAFQRYAAHIKNFHVLPIYGGQSYEPQLKALRRGVHVVVGTPGRVLDHMRRRTLDLSALKTVVLDEADEMLRMGFIEDVETVLKETPPTRQVALFSATMPGPVRRIAQTYLRDPAEITITSRTTTAPKIRQRFVVAGGMTQKLDVLTRLLETETFDAMLVFARTKQATTELAEKLTARGLAAAALNGDVPQAQRERTVAQLRDGRIDVLVATDVAARGLDVERISHVVNFDLPYDTESYVHRIGRTGRAGRSGEAILFVAPRERNMLKMIERATRQPIAPMEPPSRAAVEKKRVAKFLERVAESRAQGGLEPYVALVEQFARENDAPIVEVAAALAKLASAPTAASGSASAADPTPAPASASAARHAAPPSRPEAPVRPSAPVRTPAAGPDPAELFGTRPKRRKSEHGVKLERYRAEVGRMHDVKPANIVGAIANEGGLEAKFIGRVEILEDHTIVELPTGMPREILRDLQKARVCGVPMKLRRDGEPLPEAPKREGFKGKGPR